MINEFVIVMSQEIIKKHLSFDQNYILKIRQSSPLTNKSDFYAILKWWNTLSGSKTIGDLKGNPSSNERLLNIKVVMSLKVVRLTN